MDKIQQYDLDYFKSIVDSKTMVPDKVRASTVSPERIILVAKQLGLSMSFDFTDDDPAVRLRWSTNKGDYVDRSLLNTAPVPRFFEVAALMISQFIKDNKL